jgi:hypothetical protein
VVVFSATPTSLISKPFLIRMSLDMVNWNV